MTPLTLLLTFASTMTVVTGSPMSQFNLFDLQSLFNTQGVDMFHMQQPCTPCVAPPARRKREAKEIEVTTSEESQCNSPELREIILKNLKSSLVGSKEAIYTEVSALGNFVVACQPSATSSAFAARSERFCADGSNDQTCFVFEL